VSWNRASSHEYVCWRDRVCLNFNDYPIGYLVYPDLWCGSFCLSFYYICFQIDRCMACPYSDSTDI